MQKKTDGLSDSLHMCPAVKLSTKKEEERALGIYSMFGEYKMDQRKQLLIHKSAFAYAVDIEVVV